MYIKHIKIKTIKHARYKQVRDRERAIVNTGDLFRDSNTLALHSRLQHLKDFHYKPIPSNHSVPQHLPGVPTRTLGLSSLFTCSRKNNTLQARKLAEAAPLQ